MKINWFSPLPPAKTDIAHYTMRVLPALKRVATVTLWTDQAAVDKEVERNFEVKRYRAHRPPLLEFNRADINFYNIGNNPDFHGGIWRVSKLLSGIVVLHDFRLHHFFDGIFRVKLKDLHSYLSVMSRYYGAEGRRDGAICFRQDAKNIDEMAERYPLTELALEHALGVVVHTRDALESLSQKNLRPIIYAPLPFAAAERTPKKVRTAPPYRLVVFGYIGRNRRLESILRALAGIDQREHFRLDVFGSILNHEKQIRALVGSLGLSNQVTLHGYKTEAELDSALSQADLVMNLRYPTMGEASGSQLRIWAHALPSMVSDVGWYASLPADSVRLVRTGEHEIEDIKKYLADFLAQPRLYLEMGERGRRLLEREHSPEAYVAALMEFAQSAPSLRARSAGVGLAQRAARQAAQCVPASMLDEIYRRLATEVHALTEGR